MKKILFISYSFFGYEKQIINLMEKELKCKVFYINPEECRETYKNIIEKLYSNLILKPIFKKTLKEIKLYNNIKKEIDKIDSFDCIFCIRPDMMNHEIMKYLKKFNVPMIVHHWDSFSFIPKQKEFLEYFDFKSTFDMEEAREYGMKFVPNFYITDYIKDNIKEELDIFTVMKYDSRFETLEKIAKYLKEIDVKYKFVVVTDENIKSEYIEIQKEKISLEETYNYIAKSKAILEIGHIGKDKYQGGVSFRVADVIGNKKKLITNYEMIRKYDFYCEENVKIISGKDIDELQLFLDIPYKVLGKEIYEGYSGENWIRKIFEGV